MIVLKSDVNAISIWVRPRDSCIAATSKSAQAGASNDLRKGNADATRTKTLGAYAAR